jgi:hypothetical protein
MVVIDEKDVGKTNEQVLMDLLYEATGQRIPLDKVKFGKPREIDKRKDLDFDPNTFIPARINKQYDARYSAEGSGFMYRRRNILNHTGDCDFSRVAPPTLPFTMLDILDQINECMPYPIKPEDIINHKYTTLEEVETSGVRLDAHPESLLWIKGVAFFVNTAYINGQPLVMVTDLDGFNEWQPDLAPI